jgi:hypothetical protein
MSAPDPEKLTKLAETGAKLRLHAAIAEVTAELTRQGIPALLLKGPSIAQWLYDEETPRRYNDCDLLLSPDDVERSAAILEGMGYRRFFDDRSMPQWWREHGVVLVRQEDGVTFDLHRRLPGMRADGHAAWRILSADTRHVPVGGRQVAALGLPARALHLALHAAQHGAGWAGPVRDLERALARGDDELWRRAYGLAVDLSAVDAFGAGLRLTPRGDRVLQMLQVAPPRAAEAVLRATSPPPIALGFQQLADADGLWARFAILLRKIFPPAAFIRHWDPRAARSRSALIRAYARRPVWLLANAPAGFRAWRKAHEQINRS